MSRTILVVEDDPSIRLGLEDTLRAKSYRVLVATRGEEAVELVRAERPDLVILDIMLPDFDGFEVCRRIKSQRDAVAEIPVIMLTARGAELDRVRGLELGADDYVTKPFSLMELLARVSAVLRRVSRQSSELDTLSFGDVHIDFSRQEASKGGRALELSHRAFEILKVFASHPGQVVTRERLLEEAWGYDKYPNTRTVDNHVVKIRRAVEDEPENPKYIQTVHGAGYRLKVDAPGT